ncbi:MAG: DUF4836 family protein [Saprospiraceae bacterium]|nr:DUF4836 family protein [Saprospiraceae bacterium]
MKSIMKFSTFFALSLLFLASCTKSAKLDETANAIPKNAASVTAINLPSLMQKADFESIKQMEFYKEMVDSASAKDAAIAEIMRDPKKSGIDFTKNIYIVQDYNFLNDNRGEGSATILVSLTDAGAFEKMLMSGKNHGQINTKESIKYLSFEDTDNSNEEDITISHENSIVAWNDKMAVLGGKMSRGTEGVDFTQFFKNKGDESIVKNENFSKLFDSQHDIYSYTSFDKLADNPEIRAGAGMMNIDPKALKGNYAIGFADFEKGQIVGKSEYQINKELRKDWGLMFKDNVKTDFSKYLKGDNIGFAATLALDVKGVKEIINANPQFRIILEKGKSDKFSTDDIFKAFDGDIVIAANPESGDADKWEGMMGFKLQDKATMEKLVNFLVSENALTSEGNGVYRFGGMADMMSKNYVDNGKLAFVDDVVFVGDAATITNLKSGSSVSGDVKDVLNKNIFGLYTNFSKIFANTERMKDPEMVELKMMMNGTKGEGVLKMKDANENSLKSLFKTVNRLYLKNKEEKAKSQVEERREI